MFTFLTILGIYFGGMIAFALWEAFVGFKDIEFDGNTWPPLGLAYAFWFLAGPIATMAAFGNSLSTVRDRRIAKAEERKRIRVAAEKEHTQLMEQIEKEMLEDEQPVQRSSRRA